MFIELLTQYLCAPARLPTGFMQILPAGLEAGWRARKSHEPVASEGQVGESAAATC